MTEYRQMYSHQQPISGNIRESMNNPQFLNGPVGYPMYQGFPNNPYGGQTQQNSVPTHMIPGYIPNVSMNRPKKSKKCEHGKNKNGYYCRICGGKGVCKHGRQRSKCIACGGKKQVYKKCIHNKSSNGYFCVDCNGGGLCIHKQNKYKCKKCKWDSKKKKRDRNGSEVVVSNVRKGNLNPVVDSLLNMSNRVPSNNQMLNSQSLYSKNHLVHPSVVSQQNISNVSNRSPVITVDSGSHTGILQNNSVMIPSSTTGLVKNSFYTSGGTGNSSLSAGGKSFSPASSYINQSNDAPVNNNKKRTRNQDFLVTPRAKRIRECDDSELTVLERRAKYHSVYVEQAISRIKERNAASLKKQPKLKIPINQGYPSDHPSLYSTTSNFGAVFQC